MSLELCVLASGSAGNCSVVRSPAGVMLIDLGIGPRTAARRLAGTGVAVADVRAVCLTHLDRDHFSPTWTATILKQGITIHCHDSRADDLIRIAGDFRLAERIQPFDDAPFEILSQLRVHPIGLAHDQSGSHGFLLDGFGSRLGYATDLGRVPIDLADLFCDLDMLAIESNYDRQMQLESSRPWFLKQRIMGGCGHLSNQQAFETIRKLFDQCQRNGRPLPGHVVLLHRSRQCNCPKLVRQFFSRDVRIRTRLVLAEQNVRTEWIRGRNAGAAAGEQLLLAWG